VSSAYQYQFLVGIKGILFFPFPPFFPSSQCSPITVLIHIVSPSVTTILSAKLVWTNQSSATVFTHGPHVSDQSMQGSNYPWLHSIFSNIRHRWGWKIVYQSSSIYGKFRQSWWYFPYAR
jgi:hypothetical protein